MTDVHIIFIDFKEAFDQLKRNQIMGDLNNIEISKKSETTENTSVKGVRQTYVLLVLLFVSLK